MTWATLRRPTLMINFILKLITIFVHKGTLSRLITNTLTDLWSILRASWACQRCPCWGRGRRPCPPWRRTTPRPATSRWPAGGGSWSAPGALHRLAKTWTTSFWFEVSSFILSHKNWSCFSIFPTSDSSPSPPSQARPRGTLQTAPPRKRRASRLNVFPYRQPLYLTI